MAPYSAFMDRSCPSRALYSKKMQIDMIFGAFSATKSSQVPVETLKSQLLSFTDKCQPNGVYATPQQRLDINSVVAQLEKQNPTVYNAFLC